jgi:hypothetical protein
MSEENVEIVRRVYAEWERGNFRTPEVFDPEVSVVWINPIFSPHSETRGLEGPEPGDARVPGCLGESTAPFAPGRTTKPAAAQRGARLRADRGSCRQSDYCDSRGLETR